MEIRTARPEDLDQIEKLIVSRMDPSDGVDARLLLTDPDAGWDWCAVAVDGDRIVSTATLMDETVTLGGVEIPVGQVEQVATDIEYEGRGLVRRLMAWAHERSAQRGHLAQLMIGISHYYRQFGYTYSIELPQNRPLERTPEPVAGHTIRVATEADIPALQRLQDHAQRDADLRMPHTAPCWRWLIHRTGTTQWIVERDGAPVATGRSTPPEEGDVQLGEVTAIDDDAAKALVRLVNPATVQERHPALEPYLAPRFDQANQYYARIENLPALFEHLRPVFTERLRDQPHQEILLSFYRTHVTFTWDGEIGPFRWGGVPQDPYERGGAGIAPDLVPPLLFGPHGIMGLRKIFPDVWPGSNKELMNTLFPPVKADLLTFYLP